MSHFIVGSGYSGNSDFAPIWYNTLRRYCPFPKQIVIISNAGRFPVTADEISEIKGSNLGHLGEIRSGVRKQELCGWSASVIALALVAYNCESDLVYVEEDCLAIGQWMEKAYEDLGDKDMVFGYKHDGEPWQPCSQSLFIIRQRFLLEFVRRYLTFPPDISITPENKFAKLEEHDPNRFARLSFGVDRQRPIPWDQPIWYAQRITKEELNEMRERGFV